MIILEAYFAWTTSNWCSLDRVSWRFFWGTLHPHAAAKIRVRFESSIYTLNQLVITDVNACCKASYQVLSWRELLKWPNVKSRTSWLLEFLTLDGFLLQSWWSAASRIVTEWRASRQELRQQSQRLERASPDRRNDPAASGAAQRRPPVDVDVVFSVTAASHDAGQRHAAVFASSECCRCCLRKGS